VLALSAKWAARLNEQPETGMGYQVATVLLKDGKRVQGVMIIGGIITKVAGADSIPFVEDDITDIVVERR
jgi:hypothetical protein